jgi:hypothetical protein
LKSPSQLRSPSELRPAVGSSVGAYHGAALPDRAYTAAEVDAALVALVEPGRLSHAQDVVTHAAPTLQRMLAQALAEGGWFGETHDAQISRVASEPDESARATAVSTLVADQTRLGMFVGVAVGFELAHELAGLRADASEREQAEPIDSREDAARDPRPDHPHNQPPNPEEP